MWLAAFAAVDTSPPSDAVCRRCPTGRRGEITRVVQIRKQFRFEAAHVLPHHPGKCSRLHGHSYRLDVTLEGPLAGEGAAAGMIVDFDVVSRVVKGGVLGELDHRSLND